MKESGIVTAIQQYLQILENQGKLVFQRNNSGAVRTQRGGFLRFGKVGSPDFYLFTVGGKTIHLEVKNETGKQSEGQKDFEERVTKLGHKYLIVRDIEELEKLHL